MKRIVSDPERVFEFLTRYVPMQPVGGMKGLGLEKDGELVAGVIYEGFNGTNVWMHVAAVPGARWLNRKYLRYCFQYPFLEMGVRRISCYIEASNWASLRFNANLGFEHEATLHGAARDGGDVALTVLWRENCRFLEK